MSMKIVGVRAITPGGILENADITLANGRIVRIAGSSDGDCPTGDPTPLDCATIDGRGLYLSPGFMDIHVHGGGGHDFMDATAEAFVGAAEFHAKYGTTSMAPTTLAAADEEMKATLEAFAEAREHNASGATLLGLHIEGPYFAMEQRGAQDPQYIRNPDPHHYLKILDWSDSIIRWSAAPELEGALEFAEALRARRILPSVGHSDATSDEVEVAFAKGFTHVTHLYSTMSTVKRVNGYRYAGVLEAAYLIDDMTVEIIADGSHLPASLLRLVYKLKGPGKIALVTDALRAAGMSEGESIAGSLKNGQRVIVEDGVAKLPSRQAFAGSVATADRLVRNMVRLAGVPIPEAVRMMSLTPAEIMGVSASKGSIELGKDADLVLFDENIDVKLTIVGGKLVYVKDVARSEAPTRRAT